MFIIGCIHSIHFTKVVDLNSLDPYNIRQKNKEVDVIYKIA